MAEWAVLEQFASVFGTLIDVDWQGDFKSFFEVARIKIRCRDYTKIPADMIFGIGDKLYKILIQVEPPEEDFDDDDLLEDDLEGNRKEVEETGHGADDGNTTNSNKGGGGTASSTSSLTSNTNSGPSSTTNSRQKTMEYLK